jgi:N-acetylneuraminic acid mutarotase
MGMVSVAFAAGDKWEKKADMPTPRWSLATVAVNGRIYAIGGWTSPWSPQVPADVVGIVEEYNPEANTWKKKTDMPTARGRIAACEFDGKIYTFGGSPDDVASLSAVEVYDPGTDTWTKKGDLPVPLSSATAATVGNKIYVIGGYDKSKPKSYSLVYEYDPAQETFAKKADMPTARGSMGSAVFDGKVYVLGGYDPTNSTTLDVVEVYDPVANQWATKRKMREPSAVFGIAAVGRKIFIIGGTNPFNNGAVSRVAIYYPETDAWGGRNTTPVPTTRSNLSANEVNGRVYAIGGLTWPGASPVVEEYTPGEDDELFGVSPQGKLSTTWGKMKHER